MHSESKVEVISLPSTDLLAEIRELQNVRDRIKDLKERFDSATLAKDIRNLQEASRIQNMRPEMRDLMLKELQRRKLLKQVVDGEFA
jgi:uncharacterized membrane protein (DUF106 family)